MANATDPRTYKFNHSMIRVKDPKESVKFYEFLGMKVVGKCEFPDNRFALEPDGYWVEIVGWRPVEETAEVKETDLATYRMNHTMIRVKDAEKSLKFYQDVLGMSRMRTLEAQSAGFNLYFLGYLGKQGMPEDGKTVDREGLLEPTWNYGTEKDDDFKYHSGNQEPQGFGHICVSVDNLDAACQRLEHLKCSWKKRLTEGRMLNVAFVLDPDGYWVEIVQNPRYSGEHKV